MIQSDPKTFSRELLYYRHRLSHQQIDDFLDEKVSDNFLAFKLRLMEKVREYIVVADAFSCAGIQFIPLKGPILSYRLYDDASYRYFNDLDFLLDVKDIDVAVELLKERGYHPSNFKWPGEKRRKNILYKHNNQYGLYNPDKNILIELHWKLFPVDLINLLKQESLINRSQKSIEFSGRNFRVFDNEFEMLYLIIHGGKHGWRRLKWLVDIQQILQRWEIDFQKFNRLVDIWKAHRMVALCRSFLDIYFPDVAQKLPASDCSPYLKNFALEQISMEEEYAESSVKGIWRSLRFKMKAFPGLAYKRSVLKSFLFAVKDLDNEKLPPFSIFYYFYNPIGRIRRKIKKRV